MDTLESDKDVKNRERNEKLLDYLNDLENKYLEERKQIIEILDSNYKPTIIEVTYKNGDAKVNLFNKSELESFILDKTDTELFIENLGKIINSKRDIHDFDLPFSLENKIGGKLYKYRKNKNYTGFGLIKSTKNL